MRWNDEEMQGEAFVDWQPYEHPQLGLIEIGGWKTKLYMQNPPLKYLLEICQKHSDWTLSNASLSPYLSTPSLTVRPLSEQTYYIAVVLENNGFLPTYTSHKALERKAVRPIEVSIDLPAEVTLISGKQWQEIEHLEGRSNKLFNWFTDSSPTDNRSSLEWVVSGPATAQVELTVRAQRAGTLQRTIPLQGQENRSEGGS